jgi:hypothetical protein
MSASHLKLGERHKALNAAESCLALNENFVKVCAVPALGEFWAAFVFPVGCVLVRRIRYKRGGGLLITFHVQGYFRKIEALRELGWIDEAWDTVYECEQYIATTMEDIELEDCRNKLRKRMQVAVPCQAAALMCSSLLRKVALRASSCNHCKPAYFLRFYEPVRFARE